MKIKSNDEDSKGIPPDYAVEHGDGGAILNASGHAQELERNFSVWSAASVGICTGNTWAALGGSIVRFATPSVDRELTIWEGRLSTQWRTARSNLRAGKAKSIPFHLQTTDCKKLAASFFYWIIAACIAELASAIPSSSGGKCSIFRTGHAST